MKCAFYEKEITPPIGDDIPGYFNTRITDGVEERLYAKAVVFAEEESDPQKTAAVLSLDAVWVEEGFCQVVKERASAYTGIPVENIAVCANHTHYGMPVGGIHCERDEIYMTLIERLAADCVILAFQRLKPCTVEYGIGREEAIAYNRDYMLKDGSVFTNPFGRRDEILRPYAGIDPDVPVLSVRDEEGSLMGVIFTYACHQDTVGKYKFSGDYSSEISHQLKARYGAQTVSVYLAGCCGDINHIDHMGGVKRTTCQIGEILAHEVIRVIEEASSPVKVETIDAKYRTISVFRRHAAPEEIEHARLALADPDKYLRKYEAIQHLECLLDYEAQHTGYDEEMYLPIQIIKLGEVWFFALPGEMYHKFGVQIKEGFPGNKWLISELANSKLGYVATEELYGTDIYPGKLLDESCIEPGGGNKIVRAVLQMANEIATNE